MCIYIYIYIYISADPSACGLLNSIRFDSKSEVKRSESEAKRKAKRSESEVKRSESEAKSEAIAQRSIDEKPASSAWAGPGVSRGSRGSRGSPRLPPRAPQGTPKNAQNH